MEKEKKVWTTMDGYRNSRFSSIKRMFGEYTSPLSGFKLVKEMTMKVSLYNLFRKMK